MGIAAATACLRARLVGAGESRLDDIDAGLLSGGQGLSPLAARLALRAGRVGEKATQERGPLSPRRTGDADFPRPALLETLASGMHIKPEIRF